MFYRHFFIARNLKLCLEIKSGQGQVIRLFHQQELGCHSRLWKQLFSSPRLPDESCDSLSLLFVGTGLLLQWGHETYLSVPRLKCMKLYLHLAIRILALCLISRGTSIVFPNFCIFSYGKYLGLVFPQHVTLYLVLHHVCPLL